ncbi:MAG: hypothetical protein ABSA09_01290 [Desulfobaccales bacterium]
MQPQISICRKRGNLYLKLSGNFNRSDSEEILGTVQRLVDVSLQIFSPNTQVFFTFQTHSKIECSKRNRQTGS